MSQPVKLSDELVLDARLEGEQQQRSIAGQVEYWARLGRYLDDLIDGRARRALLQGSGKRLLSELIGSVSQPEGRARLQAVLDSEPFPHFAPSPDRKGYLVRTEADGSRSVGRFINRDFVVESTLEKVEDIAGKSVRVLSKDFELNSH
jgi:hypothetical protein